MFKNIKKKLLAISLSICSLFGLTAFTGCSEDITDVFDLVLENEFLLEQNSELKAQIDSLIATNKFLTTYPDRTIGNSDIVNLENIDKLTADKAGNCVVVTDSATVTINAGKYDGGQTAFGGAGNTAIWVKSTDAKVTINSGEFFINGLAVNDEGTKDTGHIDLIYCSAGLIEITGGTFKGANSDVWLLNCKDAAYKDGVAKIIVTGGTFFNWNPADCVSEGEHTSFLAEGYEVQTTTDADGNTLYTVVKSAEEPETPPVEELISPEQF